MNIKEANKLFSQKKYKEAALAYEQIIADDPTFGRFLSYNLSIAKKRSNSDAKKRSNSDAKKRSNSDAKKRSNSDRDRFDILITIWLSNNEPVHDIIKDTINDLSTKCTSSILFAPRPLIESTYQDVPFLETQAASIYISKSIVPSGSKLPKSFVENNYELFNFLIKREEQWLIKNDKSFTNNIFQENFIKGLRYWSHVITTYSPKVILVWGSSSPVSALLIAICQICSIEFQIIERGLLPGSLIVDDQYQFGNSYSNRLLSSAPSSNHNKLRNISLLNSYLQKIKVVPYEEFNKETLNNAPNKNKLIILFIGSNDLGAAVSLKSESDRQLNISEYQSSVEVVSDLVRSLPLINNDAILYIKPHPADNFDYGIFRSKNVEVLPSHNLNDLIDSATICCTLCTTAIAMCLLKNKPLVTFSTTDISNLGASYEVYRKSELVSQVRNALLRIGFIAKHSNADRYFDFALKYRLYFQTEFKQFGNISSDLSKRITKLVNTQSKFISADAHVFPIVTPVLTLLNNSSIHYPPVDIIIPVYDGFELTKQCIKYALTLSKHHDNVNLILINDHSPNVQLSGYLNTLASSKIQNLTVHTNNINTGFSGAVNIGLSLSRSDADILLLNSDALVSIYTLKSLQSTAYSMPNIATVCPLSTDGGLLTLPFNSLDIDILSQAQLNKINRRLLKVFGKHSLLVPVNHGACLYIKKSALNMVGIFNELVFGRGYSEEIDFCLRLRQHGLSNVGCCFAFVQHVGGVSFADSSNPLKIKNRKIISEKYPNYFNEVSMFAKKLKASDYFLRLNIILNELLKDI